MCRHSYKLLLSLSLHFSLQAGSINKQPGTYKYLIISNLQKRCENYGPSKNIVQLEPFSGHTREHFFIFFFLIHATKKEL